MTPRTEPHSRDVSKQTHRGFELRREAKEGGKGHFFYYPKMQSSEGTCNNMERGGNRKQNPTWSLPRPEKKKSYGARSVASPASATEGKFHSTDNQEIKSTGARDADQRSRVSGSLRNTFGSEATFQGPCWKRSRYISMRRAASRWPESRAPWVVE